MSAPDYRGPVDRAGLFGPTLVNLLLQTLETGFIISQFITYCDNAGRFSRWVSGIVLFVTLASLCVDGRHYSLPDRLLTARATASRPALLSTRCGRTSLSTMGTPSQYVWASA